jgi:hypothetical protein
MVGGGLLLIAGVHGSLGILGDIFEEISSLLPETADLIHTTLVLLAVIASLGGVTVIAGGFLILKKKRLTGKLFISLGGSVGVIGFAINLVSGLGLGWAILSSAVAVFAVGQSIGWIGLIISLIARITA